MNERADKRINLILEEPRNLTDEQWGTVLVNFRGHPFEIVFQKLLKSQNKPQKAIDLFDGFDSSVWNQSGVDTINAIFRNRKLPYRLTRIGTWAGEGSRANRLLAVVPWPLELPA